MRSALSVVRVDSALGVTARSPPVVAIHDVGEVTRRALDVGLADLVAGPSAAGLHHDANAVLLVQRHFREADFPTRGRRTGSTAPRSLSGEKRLGILCVASH